MKRHLVVTAGWLVVGSAIAVGTALLAGTDNDAHPTARAATAADCILIGPYGDADIYACPREVTPSTEPASTSSTSPASSSTAAPTSTAVPTTTAPAATTSTTSSAPSTSSPATGTLFSETFATASALERFDFQLRTYGPSVVAQTFRGEHDSECHGPDTYRTIQGGQAATGYMDVSKTGLVYHCGGAVANGHMMTALSTPGIAILAFSPKATFTDITKVCWDQNMNNLGGGKWANVLVVPAQDVTARGGNLTYTAALANGIGDPQFRQPPPANAYDFTWLTGTIYSQGQEVAWKSYVPGGMAASSAPRFRICLQDRGGTIVIQRPDQTVDTYRVGARFPAGPVRVIWQDASYDPDKHGGSVNTLTWHWDQLEIS